METIGPYRLLDVLGRCEIGVVWAGVDQAGDLVTVAVLDDAAAGEQRWRDAFAVTAAALARPADGLPVLQADYSGTRPWVACRAEPGIGAAQVFVALGLAYQVKGASTPSAVSRSAPLELASPPEQAQTPPSRRRSRAGRWVALGVLAALVVPGAIVWVMLSRGPGVPATPAPSQVSLAPGEVGSWDFAGGVGCACGETADRTSRRVLRLSGWDASPPTSGFTRDGHDGNDALLFAGSTGYASTSPAETAQPVVRTDQSFTVSAWVKLGDGDPSDADPDLPGNATAVAQSGSWTSAYFLGLRNDSGPAKWSFLVTNLDVAEGCPCVVIYSSTSLTRADIGRWVHLVGVSDAETGIIRLYVDGVLASSAPRDSPAWYAPGALTVGGALATGSAANSRPTIIEHWPGAIDDVRVFARAISDLDVTDLYAHG